MKFQYTYECYVNITRDDFIQTNNIINSLSYLEFSHTSDDFFLIKKIIHILTFNKK